MLNIGQRNLVLPRPVGVDLRRVWFACLCACFLGFAGGLSAQQSSAGENAERYVRLTWVNPLFAWPAVDLEEMGRAVTALEGSRAEIIQVSKTQYNENQVGRINRLLYPTGFLRQMIVLEAERRKLTLGSSVEELSNYQDQLRLTIRAYQDYLNQLLPALTLTAREQDFKGLEYHFGKSSFAHFLSGIRLYRAEAETALETAEGRWACLVSEASDCEMAQWPDIPVPKPSMPDEQVFSSGPAKIVHNLRSSGAPFAQPVKPNWAVTQSHDCYPSYDQAYFALWAFPTQQGVPLLRADVVNDVWLHDHRIRETGNTAYERKLDALGGEGFVYQSFTTHYACPDAATDIAKIRAMIHVYQALETFNWGDVDATTPQSLTGLNAMAKHILSKDYVSEDTVQEFMHTLRNLLTDGTFQARGDAKTIRVLEELLLTYQLRTPFLSRDIMNLVYSNMAIGDYVRYSPWGYLEELLFTRNAPELLLGGFNPSIVRRDFAQMERRREGVSPRLVSYVNTVSKQFNVDQVSDILIEGTRAESRLGDLEKRSYLGFPE